MSQHRTFSFVMCMAIGCALLLGILLMSGVMTDVFGQDVGSNIAGVVFIVLVGVVLVGITFGRFPAKIQITFESCDCIDAQVNAQGWVFLGIMVFAAAMVHVIGISPSTIPSGIVYLARGAMGLFAFAVIYATVLRRIRIHVL